MCHLLIWLLEPSRISHSALTTDIQQHPDIQQQPSIAASFRLFCFLPALTKHKHTLYPVPITKFLPLHISPITTLRGSPLSSPLKILTNGHKMKYRRTDGDFNNEYWHYMHSIKLTKFMHYLLGGWLQGNLLPADKILFFDDWELGQQCPAWESMGWLPTSWRVLGKGLPPSALADNVQEVCYLI